MARYILCERCDKTLKSSASQYGELYESIEGTALRDMLCDGACGEGAATPIKEGGKCFAACLLNNSSHPNYQFQKPEVWANEFLNIEK